MTTMTTTEAPNTTIRLEIGEAVGRLDEETRRTLSGLARALQHPRCDAIGESGHRCTLRAGHPGEIHEDYHGGGARHFRLTGDSWRVRS